MQQVVVHLFLGFCNVSLQVESLGVLIVGVEVLDIVGSEISIPSCEQRFDDVLSTFQNPVKLGCPKHKGDDAGSCDPVEVKGGSNITERKASYPETNGPLSTG